MGIIYRAISTHIVNTAGFSNKQAKTGAVTLIQRFRSALNLNIHFHMLFLEGAISENSWGGTTFTRIKAPSHKDMFTSVQAISHRIARYLEKVGQPSSANSRYTSLFKALLNELWREKLGIFFEGVAITTIVKNNL